MRLMLATLRIAALLAATSAWSAPDELDPRFGAGGRLQLQEGFELGPVNTLIPLPNDEFLAFDGWSLWRVDRDGVERTAIPLDAACEPRRIDWFCAPSGIARQSDGRLIVGFVWYPPWFDDHAREVGIARMSLDGHLDPAFGTGGRSSRVLAPSLFSAKGIAVQADGRIVVVGSSGLIRFLPSGAADGRFGSAGYLQVPVPVYAFAQTADHKIVLAGQVKDDTVVARLLPDGVLDTGFAANGIYRDARSHALTVHALTELPDGKLVLAGGLRTQGVTRFALQRLDRQGRLDGTFGVEGTFVTSFEEGHESEAQAVAVDGKGRVVVAGRVTPIPSRSFHPLNRIAVARFHPDGAPDTFFAGGGVTTIWSDGGAGYSVMITSSNQIVVGGEIFSSGGWSQPTLFRLKGADGSVMRAIHEGIAIEYVHALFGNYFITTSAEEIRTLDLLPGVWRRTGSSFRVWTGASPELHGVCRFFSGNAFAPRFSHFFTPYVDECIALRASPTWTFEGERFRLRLPEADTAGRRDCPAGSARLYRLYNNARDGVPRHRYTNDLTSLVSEQTLADGWIVEGDANTNVFACIPPS